MLLLLSGVAPAAARQGGWRAFEDWRSYGNCPYDVNACIRAPYDGRFTFLRVYFDDGGARGSGFRGFGREPPWHHDKPFAERNLSAILRELTSLQTFDGSHGGNAFALTDPEIFRYPILWLAEPGRWVPSDAEVRALRAFLLKGGFIIFDDFSGGDWRNFTAQMQRVLPEMRPIRLTGNEPIFRSFFDIDINALNLEFDRQPAEFWGIFEDNDPKKRQIAVINYNNDIGEYMEYSATGFTIATNEAYRLAVNYIFYALMH
jgi:hypothetical protein